MMTREILIGYVPADVLGKCMAKDRALTLKAADGCVALANSTGWLAVPEEEAIDMFVSACAEFAAR